jgi:hypothetical protein
MTFQDDTTQQQQPPPNNGMVDTGNGILVGVDPSTAQRMAGEWGNPQQQQPTQQQQPPGTRMFTEAEVEAFRQQEKDKLYGRLEEMSGEIRTMREERAAEAAAREEALRQAQEAEEAAARAREEAEMDVRTLLERRDQEWQSRFEEQDARYAADRAIFEQERRLAEIEAYRRDRIEQEQEYILPALREFITGSTPEEVDAGIEYMKARSNEIAANFAAAAQQQQPQPFRGGAMPTVPPVGPLEQLPSYQDVSPDWVAGLSMDEYKRHRPQLLQAASNAQRRGR